MKWMSTLKRLNRNTVVIDKLSSLTKQTNDQEKAVYKPGFPLGSLLWTHVNAERKILLNNHVDITIFYHKNPTNNGIQVVGFEVKADSRAWPKGRPCNSEPAESLVLTPHKDSTSVHWTYSVTWESR